ncbi:hypothetical protein F511_08822 [Dorcoceras hygrometricum]|uniref:CCHC-type domain-containing protein n=1 Tax=Dorcoceras hygrometricum TaxID=472368 RepID=A0A2Z7AJ66_9LAMI|nr:hypothetical protein F511_08822 [Dorcoceras hygrometricum]
MSFSGEFSSFPVTIFDVRGSVGLLLRSYFVLYHTRRLLLAGGCEGERRYRTLISLGLLALMRRVMPPRRRARGRGQFQESEGQNEDRRCAPSRTRRSRDEEEEVESGRQRFRPRGQQFKKKSGSGSSGSGSSSSSGSRAEFCGFCGGKHPSTQCVVVQGSCNICGQYGHFSRVCPSAGSQQVAAPPQDRGGQSR